MKKNTGGDAFPWTNEDTTCTGMTLRDHFAGLAMQQQGWTIWENAPVSTESFTKADARRCYQIADAMLEARQP